MTEELNCSEGARMLIERMQTHPKDFNHDGRFARIVDHILGKLPVGFSDLSDRDDDALSAAYDKYILEPRLTEYVVDEIFNGDKRREEELKAQADRYSKSLAASMMATKNQMATSILTGTGVANTTAQQGAITNMSNTSGTSGQQWFEHEKQVLRDMTKKTLAKLNRKSK